MIVTFGEIMMRLSTRQHERFMQAGQFDVHYGGSEANVAMALSCFGLHSRHVTKLPENELGRSCAMELRRMGTEIDAIRWGGGRLGVYYLETGASKRPSRVIYDRAESAFALSAPTDYDWDTIFNDASWFHISGITPALSEPLAQITRTACEKAQAKGIRVSCDLNYRKNLWSCEKAASVLGDVIPHVDILIANESQAASLFHLQTPHEDARDYSFSVAKQLLQRFHSRNIALTRRRTISASETVFSAALYDGTKMVASPTYQMGIIDRVGSGDAFSAGLIYGFHQEMSLEQTIGFAAAAAALKHSIPGDVLFASKDEILSLASGGSGNIQR